MISFLFDFGILSKQNTVILSYIIVSPCYYPIFYQQYNNITVVYQVMKSSKTIGLICSGVHIVQSQYLFLTFRVFN